MPKLSERSRPVLARVRWSVVFRFLVLALILTGIYGFAIRLYRSRAAEIARLDELVIVLREKPSQRPLEWLAMERQRQYAELEFLFYVFLLLIPISFILIAIIALIRSSARSGIMDSEDTDDEAQERSRVLRENVRSYFNKH